MTTTMTAAQPAVGVCWMVQAHLPAVAEIEAASFAETWDADEYIQHIRRRSIIGMVAEIGDRVVGVMVFELHDGYLQLLRIAVHPAWRRLDIGTTMIQRLTRKLSAHRRTELRVDVPESSYAAQKFFQSQGFLATDCLRQEEAYRMVYFVEGGDDATST